MLNKARLILLRHAKSDWDGGVPADFDRPLAPRGRKDAPRIGAWMKNNDFIPELVLCSPALRTRQTLEAVNTKLGVRDKNIVYEDNIYGASPGALLGLIEQHSCGNVMITGHNPGMDELLCYLCRTRPPLTATGKLMTTAAVAVLEFADAGLMSETAQGELLHLVRPGDLAAN